MTTVTIDGRSFEPISYRLVKCIERKEDMTSNTYMEFVFVENNKEHIVMVKTNENVDGSYALDQGDTAKWFVEE